MYWKLQKIFSRPISVMAFFLAFFLIGGVFYYFANFELTKGNYGVYYAWTELLLQWITSLIFAVFVAATTYKISSFSNVNGKSSTLWISGSFIALLVGGCPACSISLASYLWLSSLLVFLPFGGIELKFIGLFFLVVALYFVIRDLEVCRIKK